MRLKISKLVLNHSLHSVKECQGVHSLEGQELSEGSAFILNVCKAILSDVLFEGAEAFYKGMNDSLRDGPIVLSHCDPNETNVLASKRDYL